MSKTLLSESEIKDFMKYANLGQNTTKSFLSKLNEHSLAEAEEDEGEDEDEGPEGVEAPPAEDEEMPEETPGAEGEDAALEKAVETVLTAIVDRVSEIPGAPEITLDAGAPPEGDMPPGLEGGEEMPAGLEGEEGMPPGLEGGEVAPEEEEAEDMLESLDLYMETDGAYESEMEEDFQSAEAALGENVDDVFEGEEWEDMEEDLVNEVTRRVASRILSASRSRRPRRRRRK